MRARCDKLIAQGTRGLTVGTFHGIAHRLLRRHWREAKLPQTFQILDADDQQRLVKRTIQGLGLDEARFPPRQAAWFINSAKDEGKRPDAFEHGGNPLTRTLLDIYRAYEATCQRSGLVDFAELLLRSHELWLQRRRAARALPRTLPASADRRVPGHQHGAVRVAARAGGHDRADVRGRRRRPGDLRLARRAGRERAAFPARFSRARKPFAWNRTIAPPAPSSTPRTRSSRTTRNVSARSSGPPAKRARRSRCTPPTTSRTRRASSSSASANICSKVEKASNAPFYTAPMRSRGTSRNN